MAILYSRKKLVAIGKDFIIDKQVKLEIKLSIHPSQGDTSIQLVQEDDPEIVNKLDASQEQQYTTIPTSRLRRQIGSPQRYGYTYLVTFTLSIIESIEVHNPISYHEAFSSSE